VVRAQGILTSRVLLGGVLLSFVLLAAGIAATAWHPASAPLLLQGGLMVLMATPFLRIVVLLFEFLRGGELAFVMMGIGVLLLLCVSVWIGLT